MFFFLNIWALLILALLILLVITIVIFGASRLLEMGGAIGKSIREFKTSVQDDSETGSGDTNANNLLRKEGD